MFVKRKMGVRNVSYLLDLLENYDKRPWDFGGEGY